MEPSRPASADFDGLLLVGHGTRDPAGQAEFWQLVETIRGQNPDWLVEGSLLELAAPTIATGLASLAQRGARVIRAVPLVLFAAGHARQDIPRALAAAALDHPHVEVEQAPHLGCQDWIVELSEWRFHEAAGDQNLGPPGDTLLLLVGRGSSDAEATREMHEFAQCRAAPAGVAVRGGVSGNGRTPVGSGARGARPVAAGALRGAAPSAICRPIAGRRASESVPNCSPDTPNRVDRHRSPGPGYPTGNGRGPTGAAKIQPGPDKSKNQIAGCYVMKEGSQAPVSAAGVTWTVAIRGRFGRSPRVGRCSCIALTWRIRSF